jgi:DNA topoisomerase-1
LASTLAIGAPPSAASAAISIEAALRWLSLPRSLGNNPETGKDVSAGIGRFGPFVVHEGEFRSLEKTDDVYTVDLARALELLSRPKGGRGQRKAIEPLRTLGAHPADGEPVTLWEGRYGPYVKHGDVNASLPKGVAHEGFTLDAAVPLLAERAAAGPPKKKGRAGGRRPGGAPAVSKGGMKSAAKKSTTASGKPKSKTADAAQKKAARPPAKKPAARKK